MIERTERIVVVGAGPVGLTTAAVLAGRGVPTTVVERAPEIVRELRASTFHPPTLDMLATLGVADTLVEHGIMADTVQFRDRKLGLIAEFRLDLLSEETAHPFRVQLDQYRMACLLYERLRQSALVEFRFGHAAVNVDTDENEAIVTLNSNEGTNQVRTPFVVGADGAGSVVRASVDIEFDGLTYPERYVTVFTEMPFEETIPGIGPVDYVADPDRWCIMLRTPQHWRVLYPADQSKDEAENLTDESIYEELADLTSGRRPPLTHRRVYDVHQRVAATYRRGRVLLAGDAAHVNHPAGGMGLNGGIHDAFALGASLAAFWRGEAGDDALDRYGEQRRRAATDHIRPRSHANVVSLAERDDEIRRANHEQLRATAADPERARSFLREISMLASLEATSDDRKRST